MLNHMIINPSEKILNKLSKVNRCLTKIFGNVKRITISMFFFWWIKIFGYSPFEKWTSFGLFPRKYDISCEKLVFCESDTWKSLAKSRTSWKIHNGARKFTLKRKFQPIYGKLKSCSKASISKERKE